VSLTAARVKDHSQGCQIGSFIAKFQKCGFLGGFACKNAVLHVRHSFARFCFFMVLAEKKTFWSFLKTFGIFSTGLAFVDIL